MFFEQDFLDKILLTKEFESSKPDLYLQIYQPLVEALKREEYIKVIERLNTLIPDTPKISNIERFKERFNEEKLLSLYLSPQVEKVENFYPYYFRGVSYWMKSLKSNNEIEINKEREKSIRDFKKALWILEGLNAVDLEQIISSSIKTLTSPPLFNYSFQKIVRKIVKVKIQEVKSLGFIDCETLSNLRKHEIKLASQDLNVIFEKLENNEFIRVISGFYMVLIGLSIILIMIFSAVIPARFFATLWNVDFSISQWFHVVSLIILFAFLPSISLLMALDYSEYHIEKKYKNLIKYLNKRLFEDSATKRLSTYRRIFIAFSWFVGLEIVYVFSLLKALNNKFEISPLFYSFLSGTQIFVICFVGVLLLIFALGIVYTIFFIIPVNILIRFYQASRLTSSLIASKLSRVLVLGGTKDWKSTTDRNEIIRSLIQVSRLFKSKKLQNLSINNKYVNNRYSNIGDYIESLTIWVALPKRDTQQYFCGEVNKILKLFLIGDWDALVNLSMDLSGINVKLVKELNFNLIFRSLLAAMFPLANVLLFGEYIQKSKVFGFSYELLLLGTSYWAVISLLTILDPELNEKIEASQDFFEMFSKFLPWNWEK